MADARHHPKSTPLLDLLAASDDEEDDSAHGRNELRHGGHFEWIGQDDLDWFRERIAPVEGRLLEGGRIGDGWQMMMDKHIPGEVRYVAYMRPLPNGTTEYLSITVAPDTTAPEMTEFFADDAERLKWDSMLHSTQLVEPGRNLHKQAEQIVLWHRKYPFAFLKDRWYCLARKIFSPLPEHTRGTAAPHYGVTKVVPSPIAEAYAADELPGVKRIDEFYSMWSCRTVPSPWPAAQEGGQASPACETILLHHDNMKVPETLARVAIRTGMWKFLRGMVAATRPFVAARRARVSPFDDDPHAGCRRATGGPDGRSVPLAAVYGHAGTSAHDLVPATAVGEAVRPAPEGPEPEVEAVVSIAAPAWLPRRHDAARLHAVATAPGDLQHMSAVAAATEARLARARARRAAAASLEAEDAEAARRWHEDASAQSLSDAGAGGSSRSSSAADDMSSWMGWLPRGTRPPPRPAAPAPLAAADAALAPRTPWQPARYGAAAAHVAPSPARPLPPSEAAVGDVHGHVVVDDAMAEAAASLQLHPVLSDPGLYKPGKTCDEGTQTWDGAADWRGPVARVRRRQGQVGHEGNGSGTPGLIGGLARSVLAGAAAGVAVLLLAHAADGGNGGQGGGTAVAEDGHVDERGPSPGRHGNGMRHRQRMINGHFQNYQLW